MYSLGSFQMYEKHSKQLEIIEKKPLSWENNWFESEGRKKYC